MNTPLLFINTPNHIKTDKSQYKYDSRITKNLSFSPYEKQIKELVMIYGNGIRIAVEISTRDKIYLGYITNYLMPFIILKDELNEYRISINDCENLQIKKIGA